MNKTILNSLLTILGVAFVWSICFDNHSTNHENYTVSKTRDSEPALSSNNRLCHTLDTTGRRIFNVLEFGAAGDDSTNDVKALQAAVDAATALSGEVFLPKGIYIVHEPVKLKSDIVFKGAGRGETIIKASDSWIVSGQDAILIYEVGSSNISVEDLTLDGNNDVLVGTGPSGVYTYDDTFTNNSHLVFKNVEVKETSVHGMTFYGSSPSYITHLSLDNIWIHHCGDHGNAAGMFLAGANYVQMSNSVIDSCYQHGIYNSFGHDILIENSVFRHNGYGDSAGVGISIRSDSNFIINNCLIEFNAAAGIGLTNTVNYTTDVTVSNNIIKNNNITDAFSSQVALYRTKDVKIIRNLIRKTSAETSNRGIYFSHDNTGTIIENNEIIAINGIVISGQVRASNITITNNKIRNMNDSDEKVALIYGIQLYTSSDTSYNVNITGNIIDTALHAIGLMRGWKARHTVVENNIIATPINSYVYDVSSALDKHIRGNKSNIKK